MNTLSQDSISTKKILTQSSSEKETQREKISPQGQDTQTSGNDHLKITLTKPSLRTILKRKFFLRSRLIKQNSL